MRPVRALVTTPLAALAMVVLVPIVAFAASSVSDEVAGSSVASRAAADALRDGWVTAVSAGGYTAPSPLIIPGPVGSTLSGVIGTTAAGTTVSVERTRYSSSSTDPAFVSASSNPGTAACTGSGLTLQGSAPRPTSIVGNAGCTNGNGTVYTESGGAGESTTRDAVTFTFSRPVWAFGAWFGDLETRTDGLGVPALVRVLDSGGAIIEQFQITPAGNQSACGGGSSGCGNGSTRWVGVTDVMASAMVVIVGDEDATGTALDEGIGFVGPNAVDAVPQLTLAIDTTPIGPVNAGDEVDVPVTLRNPGDVPVSSLSGLSCPSASVAAGAASTCTVAHTVSQAELDAGEFTLTASVSGDWTGLPANASDTEQVPLVQSVDFTVDLAADITEFDTVGAVISYTATITNTGNQTGQPDTITIDDVTLTCTPTTDVAPGDTITCTGTLTTTTGADVTRTATATWPGGSTASNPVTVTWIPRPSFTVDLAADITEFDTVGALIGYTATITNTGNQTGQPDTITIDDVTLTCTPTTDVAPGDTITCTGTLTTTTGADVTRTATATWPGGSTDSNPVTVTWIPGEVDDADDGLAVTGFIAQGLALSGFGALGVGALLWAFGAHGRRRG